MATSKKWKVVDTIKVSHEFNVVYVTMNSFFVFVNTLRMIQKGGYNCVKLSLLLSMMSDPFQRILLNNYCQVRLMSMNFDVKKFINPR